MEMLAPVAFADERRGGGANVPDLPGVISVGDSREEVERLIAEAIQFHVEGMREEGIEIPPPSSFAGSIEIQRPA